MEKSELPTKMARMALHASHLCGVGVRRSGFWPECTTLLYVVAVYSSLLAELLMQSSTACMKPWQQSALAVCQF